MAPVSWFLVTLLSLTLANCAAAQESRTPLTVSDILKLIDSKVADDTIINHIQQYKVDFGDKRNLDALVDAGVNRRIREAIEENPFGLLNLTFPNNNDLVSEYIQVEGWGKSFTDKHLWLFVHKKGGSDWTPQGSEVVREKTGEWKHNVYIGRPQDAKVEFEIKAMWVDLRSHRALENYFQFQCRKVNNECLHNCPGIRLPEGIPTAQVTVIRLN